MRLIRMATLTGLAATLQELLAKELAHPTELLFGFGLILLLVYAPLLPSELRMFTDTPLGRVFGMAFVYGIAHLGWIYGALALFAFLLVLASAPRREGFTDIKPTVGPRWFVERMLGERPKVIQTDRVETLPVQ